MTDVSGLAVGDRVLTLCGSGAFASEVLATPPGHQVHRMPDAMSFDEAASFNLTYGTGYHGLIRRGGLRAGESVVVLGASGGCGSAAVQIAKAAGATVIAVAGGAEKCDLARRLGADAVLDHQTLDSLSQAVKEHTDGRRRRRGVRHGGGTDAREPLRSLAWNGRYLVIGFAAGDIPTIKANQTILKCISIVGVAYGMSAIIDPRANMRGLRPAVRLVRPGQGHSRHRAPLPLGPGGRGHAHGLRSARPGQGGHRDAGMSRVAIVTGGASGIGRATVELLESQGVKVAVFDRNAETPVDVSDAASVGRAVEEARGRLGPIDILVNAAGIGTGGPLDGEHYVEVWERTLAVNLTAAMFLVRACLDDLVRSGNGRIVNVASTEALSAGPYTSPYTVSKHGLLGFTRSLAVDLAGQGVTANCVCPGATLTGLTEGIPAADREKFARRHVPVGRYGRPEEVAYMIVALTALQASFVNGAVIAVDGGMTARGR